MDIENLYDFQGQIQQAVTRAREDIAKTPDAAYKDEMIIVQGKLELALTWVEQAIRKQIAVEYPDVQAASEKHAEPQNS